MVSEYYSKLKCAARFAENKGHRVGYVALRGSQNYGLATEKSDFDYVVVVIPSFEDLLRNGWLPVKVYDFEGGHIEIYDIREYFSCIWKMNPAILETLMTQHNIDMTYNKMFESIYSFDILPMIAVREEKLARAIKGIFMAYYDKYEKQKDMGKSIAHMIRLNWFLETLKNNLLFVPNMKEHAPKKLWLTAVMYKSMPNDRIFQVTDIDTKAYVEFLMEDTFRLCEEVISRSQNSPYRSKETAYQERIQGRVSALIEYYIKEEKRKKDEGNQA